MDVAAQPDAAMPAPIPDPAMFLNKSGRPSGGLVTLVMM